MTYPGHEFFEQIRSDWENRFNSHKSEVSVLLDKHHSENRTRLQNIDAQSVANGEALAVVSVKLNALYGEAGQPGAVDRLTAKVSALGDKISYAAGGIAAVIIGVGWWIEHSHK